MTTAIVHEWFETAAGSERVVEQFLQTFPSSDVYSLVDFLPESQRSVLRDKPVQTSFVQKLPFAKNHFRNYLPLMPMAIEQFDLGEYETVLSSNHAFAKGVITRPDQMHVCYIHTPIRYAWELQHEYLRQSGLTSGIKASFVRATLHYLRVWDRLAADRVDAFIANSHYIAERVRKTYRRPAAVIHPPVNVDDFTLAETKDDFYLAASRLVPYKRVDLIVDAFAQMPDRKLVVIGDGSEYEKIAAKATPNVEMLGFQSQESLREHMQKARAFLFAAEEDFGIMPVEAQACGTPVIAFGRGGSRETVVENTTGLFFNRQTPNAIVDAVDRFETMRQRFIPQVIREHAEQFSPERFRREIFEFLDAMWDKFRHHERDTPATYDAPFPLDQTIASVSASMV